MIFSRQIFLFLALPLSNFITADQSKRELSPKNYLIPEIRRINAQSIDDQNIYKCPKNKISPFNFHRTEAINLDALNKTLDKIYRREIRDIYSNKDGDYGASIIKKYENYVCGIQVNQNQDPSRSLTQSYYLKSFENRESAFKNNFQITHYGKCGYLGGCSTLKYLKLYMEQAMTGPVKICGMKGFHSFKVMKRCMQNIGFSGACLDSWLVNLKMTRKFCAGICVKQMFKNLNDQSSGELNECLQCDEDRSGPMFKYLSGRTRRNSGIRSEIGRGEDEIKEDLGFCY